jgi:hypothetical protein
MKAQLVLFTVLVCGVYSQNPPIWSVTGGPIGVGSCYDIVTEEVTFPAYKWNYKQQNSVNVRGQDYLIPDETFGYSSPAFKNDTRIMLMDSFSYYYKNYLSSWSINAGANIEGINLSLAFSHTKGQINEFVNSTVNYFAENVMTWSEFILQVWPGAASWDPNFMREVNKLPKEYDPSAYGTFIHNFGTHVISKAWYGAAINFTSVFHSNLINQKSITWVENQVKLTIGYMMLNAGMNWNSFNNNTKVDNTFLENAKNVTFIQGGQPDVLQSDGFKAWFQTVLSNYAIVFSRSQIDPLYKLIPDAAIANNLKTATIAYGTGKLRIAKRTPKRRVNSS